jgi:hypothetical protein
LNRRLKTFIYLFSATVLSGVGSVFNNTLLFLFTGFACVLFGVGLVISNYNYRRYAFSTPAIIIAFIIIFIYGTIPFYNLGLLVYDDLPLGTPNYASFAFGMLGGFLLCFSTIIICYKGILINWANILLMICLPFIAFELIQIPWLNKLNRLSSAIIIFQPLLTLIIVVSIKSESRKNIQLPDESAT